MVVKAETPCQETGAREVAIPMAPRSSIFETRSLGEAQPLEAPLEVEVVQLQQSHPALLAV
jgi:hypothetical protein